MIARFFGARRKAFNWTLEQIKADIDRFQASGEEHAAPSFYSLRKRWNASKSSICVDEVTGEVWWPRISKEVFSDGIKGATDGYWRWTGSKSGKNAGRKVGFPKFKRRGKDRDRFTFSTGGMRIEHDRGHLLAGNRVIAAVRVAVLRPQQPNVEQQSSIVGIDVGVRCLATVATPLGVIQEVANPKALEHRLADLRRLNRQRSRRHIGSSRYKETSAKLRRLHAEVANTRRHAIHTFTTNVAKTHGTVVVEGLDVAAMLTQEGLPGARIRRRGLSDAGFGEIRRPLRYRCGWYGSTLIEADRFFPSSKTCHSCGYVQEIGWSEHWSCEGCGVSHHRDDNAAINLARWTSGRSGDLGGVAAPVKRGAEHQTGSFPAAGDDTRKGGPASVGLNNSVRSTT